MGRDDHALAQAKRVLLVIDGDLRFAVDDLNEGVERRQLLGKFLSRVEGGEGHIAGDPFHDRFAYDGIRNILDDLNDDVFLQFFQFVFFVLIIHFDGFESLFRY